MRDERAKDEKPRVPDWQRMKYPDEATFDRICAEHPELAYDAETNDYRPFVAIPGWIRLQWPSRELWERANRTEAIEEARALRAAGHKARIPDPFPVARVAWADVMAKYPDREGIPAHEQDAARLLTYWPDCYGQLMIEVELLVSNITINDTHYGRGRHRVPVSVGHVLRDADRRAREEVIKAVMPKTHPDRLMVISALQGASA